MSAAFRQRDDHLHSTKSHRVRIEGGTSATLSAGVGVRNREWIDCLQSNTRERVQ